MGKKPGVILILCGQRSKNGKVRGMGKGSEGVNDESCQPYGLIWAAGRCAGCPMKHLERSKLAGSSASSQAEDCTELRGFSNRQHQALIALRRRLIICSVLAMVGCLLESIILARASCSNVP
jgi:hypothetical protein